MFNAPQMPNAADILDSDQSQQITSRRRTILGTIFMLFMAAAPVYHARAAPDLIARTTSLPMRNIQIEVKQIQRSERLGTGLQSVGSMVVGGSGEINLQGQVTARQQQEQQSGSATQQILVINGRAARIALTHRTPIRVVQTFVRSGALVTVAGTLLLDAGDGFIATPRWDGSEQVELELEAFAASGTAHQTSSRTASVLSMPLNAWISIARSDTQSQAQTHELGGAGQSAEQAQYEVQVRLSVR
jgi:hypothetical protein